MKKRNLILVFSAFILILLIGSFVFLHFVNFLNHQQIEYYPTNNKVSEEQIKRGNLGIRYLTESELRILTLDADLGQVEYLKGLDLSKWVRACKMGLDCIPAITEPFFVSAEEAEWLGEWSLVIGVKYKGVSKAYPLDIMNWHHIVNDSIADIPVVVTFDPLSSSALVFESPTQNGKPLEFGVSGRLYNANLLMYDRKTGSLWQQFEGRLIAGPLLGKIGTLKQITADIVPWKFWKETYPNTQVLSRESKAKTPLRTIKLNPKRYDKQPYAKYQLRKQVGHGVDVSNLQLRGISSKQKVVGIKINGKSKAYPEHEIINRGILNDELGGVPILVVVTQAEEIKFFKRQVTESGEILWFKLVKGRLVDKNTGTEWNFSGESLSDSKIKLEEILATPSYWFSWLLFHPNTELFISSTVD